MPLSDDPEKRQRQLANLTARPPAPPAGNVRTLRHGGTARKATLIRAGSWAAAIMAELEAEAPLRGPDGGLPTHDRQAVELLASVLARLEAVSSWLDSRPAVNEKGEQWPAEDTAGRLRREAARLLGELGMTPRARAALGLDLVRAAGVAEADLEVRAARERFDARAAGLTVNPEEGDDEGT